MADVTGNIKVEAKNSANGKEYFVVHVNGKRIGNTFDAQLVGDFKTGDYVTVSTVKKGEFTNVGKIVFAQGAPVVAAPRPSIESSGTDGVVHRPTQQYQSLDTARSIQLQVSLKCAVELVNATVPLPDKNSKASLRNKQASVLQVASAFFEFLKSGGILSPVEKELTKHDEFGAGTTTVEEGD